MKTLRTLLLIAVTCAAPALALAQWQWLDKDGRKVFSDRPPPSDIPANRVLRQPGAKPGATPSEPVATEGAAVAEAPAVPAGSAPKPVTTNKDLETKKKQADAAKDAASKAEASRRAQMRTENCARANSAKQQLASGMRIRRFNAKGESEVMDDKQRQDEAARLDTIIAAECKPA